MLFLSRRYVSFMTALFAAALASAATTTDRVWVSREQVVEAMRSAGVVTTADQLQLLSNVTTVPGAALKVVRVTRESSANSLATLNCRQPGQCLPFYVLVHEPDAADKSVTKLLAANPTISSSPTVVSKPLVARGQMVTLFVEGSDYRIALPVICLESGRQGQAIKVASPDRRRTYIAEVVSNKIVRSTF